MLELGAQPRSPKSDRELDELLDVARVAAGKGADIALRWTTRRDELDVEEKAAPGDFVSEADRASEQAIREVIARRRPEDGILGEEGGLAPGHSDVLWAVDPIDGTADYLYDRAAWAVSVAAVRIPDHRVLAGVVIEPALRRVTAARIGGGTWCNGNLSRCRSEVDLARVLVEINLGRGSQRAHAGALMDHLVPRVRDIRDGGSAACALAAVASGRIDAYWGAGLRVWDGAAGLLLVEEAGGLTGDLGGQRGGSWPSSGDALAANHEVFEQLRQLLCGVYPVCKTARFGTT